MDKPFSQACENNKAPILAELRHWFAHASRVLEIGSGTGQHGVFFATHLPHLIWQTSDQPEYHAGIQAWLDEAKIANLRPPLALKIGQHPLPQDDFDAVFSANTAHIMQPHEVRLMMESIATALPAGGIFCQYGPFTLDGEFSSQSNADFHRKLIAQGYGGYRDLNELKHWARPLELTSISDMPANNLLLVWCKQ